MPGRPLEGTHVLELGHIVAAPYATLVLADLGADVVKVESPKSGDRTRTGDKTFKSMFHTLNRDKRSVTIDLKSEEGRARLYRLAEKADVFLENFAPGTAEKLGVGYETISDLNPEIVYASIKGYADGPYRDRLSNDPVAEAMSGLMNMTGHEDQPPVRVGASPIDMMAASNAVIGILAALLDRERTGSGQHIRAPLFEAAVGMTSYWLMFRQIFDEEPKRAGAALYEAAMPYSTYRTANGERIFIGCPNESSWNTLKDILDIDVDEAVDENRHDHHDEINEIVEQATKQWKRDELVEVLSNNGVQGAPVNEMSDVLADPHLDAVDLFTEVDVRDEDEQYSKSDIKVPKFPIWSDAFEVRAGERGPPELGEDTQDVLEQLDE